MQEPLHGTRVDFVIDLHSHSNTDGGFLFINPDSYVYDRVHRQIVEQVFPLLLSQQCAAFGVV